MPNRCDDCGKFMSGGKLNRPNICYTCDLDRIFKDQEMLSNA